MSASFRCKDRDMFPFSGKRKQRDTRHTGTFTVVVRPIVHFMSNLLFSKAVGGRWTIRAADCLVSCIYMLYHERPTVRLGEGHSHTCIHHIVPSVFSNIAEKSASPSSIRSFSLISLRTYITNLFQFPQVLRFLGTYMEWSPIQQNLLLTLYLTCNPWNDPLYIFTVV